MKIFTIELEGKKIEFKAVNWAEKANGEALVRCGDTQVLATATMSESDPEEKGFFPLIVNYEERFYARGKILGSRYMRREGRPSDNATLISRLIDRSIRPVFPDGFKRDVQIVITCLSWDGENDPDILSLLATSLALQNSDIPWNGPIAAIRIGRKDNQFIANPTYEERENSELDVILNGIEKDNEILINMIEASAEETQEKVLIEATQIASKKLKKLIDFQKEIQKEIGKEKIAFKPEQHPEIEKAIKESLDEKIENTLFDGNKTNQEREKSLRQVEQELIISLLESFPKQEIFIKESFEKQVKNVVSNKILEQGKRIGNRGLDEIRPLHCEVDSIARVHGSGLFSRGLTRSLSILTLGGPGERQLIDGMEISDKKRFFHHYNFPPYSVGDVSPMRSPNRREIGHGSLAEKALMPLIPDMESFPYTIRIVSEMLCSNGSTSMASVCSSSLALLAAGVPIKNPAAGIAIGIIQNEKEYKLLTDIQGPEDAYGGMDFKVAGTESGVTAIQMDVKIPGINLKIFQEALEKAKEARLKILSEIKKVIPGPRQELSVFAPRIFKIQIPPKKIGELIGPKGKTIREITESTGADIDIDDSGLVFVTAENKEKMEDALAQVRAAIKELETGDCFSGTIEKILDFGIIIRINANNKGLLRNPEKKQTLKIGDKINVEIAAIDRLGRINLTAKTKKDGGGDKPKE